MVTAGGKGNYVYALFHREKYSAKNFLGEKWAIRIVTLLGILMIIIGAILILLFYLGINVKSTSL